MKITYIIDRKNMEVEEYLRVYNIVPHKSHMDDLSKLPDFVLFDGGEDVNPKLYNHEALPTTFFSDSRDKNSIELFTWANHYGIPKVGICRGSQFLHVMNGGILIQDVTNHCRVHDIELATGEVFPVRCGHHQMGLITPENEDKVIGWSYPKISTHYKWWGGEFIKYSGKEPEVYQWDDKTFAVQYHPEWLPHEYQSGKYFISKVKELVNK